MVDNIKLGLIKKIGSLLESLKGKKNIFNIASWNYKEPKCDLRDSGSEHEKMYKRFAFQRRS